MLIVMQYLALIFKATARAVSVSAWVFPVALKIHCEVICMRFGELHDDDDDDADDTFEQI